MGIALWHRSTRITGVVGGQVVRSVNARHLKGITGMGGLAIGLWSVLALRTE